MSIRRGVEDIHPLPYEPLTDQLAKEQLEYIEGMYGTDPRVIVANLHQILHEFGHSCLELGMGLADNFPNTGLADIVEAYGAGIEQGKTERGH